MTKKRSIRKIILWAVFSMYLVLAIVFFYYLPRTQMVNLVGTEVKRMDKKNKDSQSRDVRLVVASDYQTNETLMFRNEDMPWPPYFKFNSGDLSGKVMNLEENREDAPILATYYGWRIPILSLYPNITDVKVVDKNYQNTPWFNIIFLTAVCIFSLLIVVFIFRKTKD